MSWAASSELFGAGVSTAICGTVVVSLALVSPDLWPPNLVSALASWRAGQTVHVGSTVEAILMAVPLLPIWTIIAVMISCYVQAPLNQHPKRLHL